MGTPLRNFRSRKMDHAEICLSYQRVRFCGTMAALRFVNFRNSRNSADSSFRWMTNRLNVSGINPSAVRTFQESVRQPGICLQIGCHLFHQTNYQTLLSYRKKPRTCSTSWAMQTEITYFQSKPFNVGERRHSGRGQEGSHFLR